MGQPDKITQTIQENMGLVYFVIHRHFPTFIGDEDILQEAQIGLWKACKTFNDSKGKFSSYAVVCIINNIRMYLRRMRSQNTFSHLSLDEFVDEAEEMTLGSLIEDPSAMVESSAIFVKDFISTLDEREKAIIWFQLNSVTQREASQALGFTQTWYSRLLTRIKKKYEQYEAGKRYTR